MLFTAVRRPGEGAPRAGPLLVRRWVATSAPITAPAARRTRPALAVTRPSAESGSGGSGRGSGSGSSRRNRRRRSAEGLGLLKSLRVATCSRVVPSLPRNRIRRSIARWLSPASWNSPSVNPASSCEPVNPASRRALDTHRPRDVIPQAGIVQIFDRVLEIIELGIVQAGLPKVCPEPSASRTRLLLRPLVQLGRVAQQPVRHAVDGTLAAVDPDQVAKVIDRATTSCRRCWRRNPWRTSGRSAPGRSSWPCCRRS